MEYSSVFTLTKNKSVLQQYPGTYIVEPSVEFIAGDSYIIYLVNTELIFKHQTIVIQHDHQLYSFGYYPSHIIGNNKFIMLESPDHLLGPVHRDSPFKVPVIENMLTEYQATRINDLIRKFVNYNQSYGFVDENKLVDEKSYNQTYYPGKEKLTYSICIDPDCLFAPLSTNCSNIWSHIFPEIQAHMGCIQSSVSRHIRPSLAYGGRKTKHKRKKKQYNK
jgi:hypothetical protein